MAYPYADGTPGEPSLRGVLGLVPDLVSRDPAEVAVTLRDRHGHVVRIPGLHPAIDADVYLVTHPDDVQRILQTEPNHFGALDVPGAHDFGKVVENSIVSLGLDEEDQRWTQRTRMLSPEFTERAMDPHVPAMVEETLASLAEFTNPHADPGAAASSARVHRSDGTVSLLPAMRRLSLRLLGSSLFGADTRAHETQVIGAVDTLRAAFKRRQVNVVTGRLTRHLPEELHLPSFLGDRVGDPYIRVSGRGDRQVYEALDALVDAADGIAGRRESTPRAFDDGLSTWLVRPDPVTGETLSPETLRQEILGLLIAGHATTSAALTWAFYLLASRPAMQERIHEEARATDLLASLERVREDGADTATGEFATEAGRAFLDSLPYTRQVWQETLRLYPALPIFGRTTNREVELGGVALPEGAHVLVSPYVTHRDPEFWPEPERFDPDRFERETRAEGASPDERAAQPRAGESDRPAFAYYPFSGGRHACLGREVATAEALVILATTLATHRVEFVGNEMGPHPDPADYAPEVGVDSAINLQPDRDVTVRLVSR
jgi:cytochrome P450